MDKHRLAQLMRDYIGSQDDQVQRNWKVTDQRVTRTILVKFMHEVFGLELEETIEYDD